MDRTRDDDLKELYEAREGKSVEEREDIERLMYKIESEGRDEDIVEARQELVGAVRNSDSKHIRVVSERIKEITYKKGTDRNG